MDRIQAMQLFVRVSEYGSFTRAADAMRISRPAASITIQQLEDRLGTRLLSRTTRHVELTPDGLAYYERCQRLLSDLEEADTLFRQADAPPHGQLRVKVPGRLGRRVLLPALPEFLTRYPEIDLELDMLDRPLDLIHAGIDCALRIGAPCDDRLMDRPIGLLAQGNYASPRYLSRYGTPREPADLSRHLAVRYLQPATGKVREWEYLENGECRTLVLQGPVTVNHIDAYIDCARAGLGLIQVPVHDVADYLDSGELVEILPRWRAAPLPLSLCYSYRRHLSRRIQAFASWIEELFAPRLRALATPALATSSPTPAPVLR
ncbi:LysR family transcriptional regulator [Chitinimonas lacunae]|uniref:LysR family transcriptional regulator n=1 Tax=Chitinimonas lacunae TaxID=1963018 RepID=A0ABV8MM62_9NEIS